MPTLPDPRAALVGARLVLFLMSEVQFERGDVFRARGGCWGVLWVFTRGPQDSVTDQKLMVQRIEEPDGSVWWETPVSGTRWHRVLDGGT